MIEANGRRREKEKKKKKKKKKKRKGRGGAYQFERTIATTLMILATLPQLLSP